MKVCVFKVTLIPGARHVSGSGAAGAGPEELAAVLWEPRTVKALYPTNSYPGKAKKTDSFNNAIGTELS